MATDIEQTARAVVTPHLQQGERVEQVLVAKVRAGRRGGLERFFGTSAGGGQPIVLTDRRLLVLAKSAKPGKKEWLDVQFARERVNALLPQTHGGLSEVHLETGLGSRRVVAPTGRVADLERLARLLRGDRRRG